MLQDKQQDQDLKRNNKNRTLECLGNKVLLKSINPKKLDKPWTGPFNVYNSNMDKGCVQIGNSNYKEWVSIRRLKPFKEGEVVVSTVP